MDQIARIFLSLTHLFIFIGMILRRSTSPKVFGLYSWSYLILLFIVAATWLIWPYLFYRWKKTNTGPNSISIVATIAFCLLVIECLDLRPLVGERDGFFHPHLQMVTPTDEKSPPPRPYGLRSGPVDLNKKDNEWRLVILGGSTALNIALPYEESIAGLLQQSLQTQFPNKKITVINAANVWFTSQHSVINYLQRVRPLKPDCVIVFHAVNDMARSFSPPIAAVENFRVDYSHFLGPQIDLFKRTNEGAWAHSNTKYIFTEILFSQLKEINTATREDKQHDWPSFPIFQRNMRTLVDLCQQDGVAIILGTQGHLIRDDMSEEDAKSLALYQGLLRNKDSGPSLKEVARAFKFFNESTTQLAKEKNLPLADLENAVPATRECFTDSVHLTAKGARLSANEFHHLLSKVLMP